MAQRVNHCPASASAFLLHRTDVLEISDRPLEIVQALQLRYM
ncbi:MAG TPA: hypothetical protein VN812_08285 [Candidatus Acidoferrales bacterium]|nr:hypothetical protein [Candidatus Acidoferrales bacterium]